MHPHGQPHPFWVPNRLRTLSQFVRVIEGTDMQIQRCMRGASMVSSESNSIQFSMEIFQR